MSFAVPTCHWACSTPNRAEGSPRRSNNSDGKVRLTFARCDFCFHIFCQVRFLIIFFCQVRLPPEPGSDGVSPPVCSSVFCLHAGIIHCWIALCLISNGLDLRCCTCWRLSRTPRRWRVSRRRRATSSRGLTSLSSLSSPWYYFEDNYHQSPQMQMPSSFIIVFSSFSFASLWFSGLGSGLSLVISSWRGELFLPTSSFLMMSCCILQVIAQYTAFKIQHEHDMTLAQR